MYGQRLEQWNKEYTFFKETYLEEHQIQNYQAKSQM